ncbi:hypothetical protein [Kordia sp.]|uniref:hypothetical protein n=1 Tax=Kordia sp. TaxID=1965332 RepID=UPI003D28F0A5
MKKLLTLFTVTLLSICACTNDKKKENLADIRTIEIAKLNDGKIVFTDKKELIINIENSLKKIKKLSVELTDLNIEYSKAIDNEKVDIIQLIGKNNDGSIKVSYPLEKVNETFRIISIGSIVVCKGCAVGCNPKRKENGDGYCTECNYSDAINCEKAEHPQLFTE